MLSEINQNQKDTVCFLSYAEAKLKKKKVWEWKGDYLGRGKESAGFLMGQWIWSNYITCMYESVIMKSVILCKKKKKA
jgi:hypothetical protein